MTSEREKLIEEIARVSLDRRGFAFYTDPMEGGQDAYDISCDALWEANNAVAIVMMHLREVTPAMVAAHAGAPSVMDARQSWAILLAASPLAEGQSAPVREDGE